MEAVCRKISRAVTACTVLLFLLLFTLETADAGSFSGPVTEPPELTAPALYGEGTWYMLGSSYGGYLSSEDEPSFVRGTLSGLSEHIRFRLLFNGSAIVVMTDDGSGRYLADTEQGGTVYAEGSITDYGIWNLYYQGLNGSRTCTVLRNLATGRYLLECGDGSLETVLPEDLLSDENGYSYPEGAYFCFRNTGEYGEGMLKEELSSFTVDNISLKSPGAEILPVFRLSVRAGLVTPEDFIYETESGLLTVGENGELSVNDTGTATVTAVHKYTGRSASFRITVTKNAVIVVPGILGSDLEDSETGEMLWSEDVLSSLLTLSGAASSLKKLDRVFTEISGGSIVSAEGGCGMGDGYKKLLQLLEAGNTEGYEIIFYSYDWRQSPETIGKELSDFIDAEGYDSVSFVAHSLGGLAVAHYLALKDANRKKTEKVISLGVPYLGAPVLYQLLTGNTEAVSSLLGDVSVPKTVLRVLTGKLTEYLLRLPSVYSLLPTEQAFSEPDSWTPLRNTGSYGETAALLAKYIEGFDTELYLAAAKSDAKLYRDGNHVILGVKTYFVYGAAAKTVLSTDLSGEEKAAVYSSYGDGIVPRESAVLLDAAPDFCFRWNLAHEELGGDGGYSAEIREQLLSWVYGE